MLCALFTHLIFSFCVHSFRKMGRELWDTVSKVKDEAEASKEAEEASLASAMKTPKSAKSPATPLTPSTSRKNSSLGLDGRVKVSLRDGFIRC